MNEDKVESLALMVGLIIITLIITSTVTYNLTRERRLKLIMTQEGTSCYDSETLIKLDC